MVQLYHCNASLTGEQAAAVCYPQLLVELVAAADQVRNASASGPSVAHFDVSSSSFLFFVLFFFFQCISPKCVADSESLFRC